MSEKERYLWAVVTPARQGGIASVVFEGKDDEGSELGVEDMWAVWLALSGRLACSPDLDSRRRALCAAVYDQVLDIAFEKDGEAEDNEDG